MKNIIITILAIIVIGFGVYFFIKNPSNNAGPTPNQAATSTIQQGDTQNKESEVIGKSVEGRDIVAYHFGLGTTTETLFVGGIHGGYEWNTALVAYKLVDYLKANLEVIPANLKITIIPVLNPDGLAKIVASTTASFSPPEISPDSPLLASARFNGHNVDLNRNFDCDWQTSAKWQNKTVSGGTAVFSEPESQAIKNYVEANKPTAVIVWYSAAGGVYASNCHNGVSSETNVITKKFASASGYPAYESFDFYATTGDMTNWLAKINIPAISVLLSNHTDTEWTKNLAGVETLLKYYEK